MQALGNESPRRQQKNKPGNESNAIDNISGSHWVIEVIARPHQPNAEKDSNQELRRQQYQISNPPVQTAYPRLIPLTQVRPYVVGAVGRIGPPPCVDCLA